MTATILILLVEDDAIIRASLKDALKDGGFEIIEGKNGSLALAVVEERKNDIRGLITDIDLGGGPNGWEVATHARELIPDLPVVYMTGAHADEWTAHGVPNSILIQKPFAPAQVITAISGLMNTGGPHP